ncbi:DoxX-like protein [Prauserella shujinwangii]|uniref:DoxX-like protein n=1 Tax=Prauserella shujinwangii TaxID=1453103 RepID=A0A2T0LUI0_9PSEU|nr:DoxX family protein [Prauserella shujinwangii]PRX47476.1 DoxX-like protein [Prauserella shujinwangii]
MSIVIGVLSLLLTVAFLGAAGLRIAGARQIRATDARLGVPPRLDPVIGALELAAVAGLIAGFWFRPLALAASVGLVLLMIGAVAYHLRARDPAALTAPAATLGVLAVANAVLLGLA